MTWTGYRLVLLNAYAVRTGERRVVGTRDAALTAARELVRDGMAFRVDLYRLTLPDSYGTWEGMVDATGFVPATHRKVWQWR